MADRHSHADEPQLVKDPELVARIESENSLRQFDAAMEELELWLADDRYKLRPSLIYKLHRILLEGLSQYAGVPRTTKVRIRGSGHVPPEASQVPALVEELCDYVNEHWSERSAVHLAAYVLWRMNWIHPFVDGNGRTARIISYLVLCAHSKNSLPGPLTIPEQISKNKQPYYRALESADQAYLKGHLDISMLEELISAHLANQLLDFYEKAAGLNGTELDEGTRAELSKVLEEARRERGEDRQAVYAPYRSSERGILSWVERHPVLVGLMGLIIVTILGILFGR